MVAFLAGERALVTSSKSGEIRRWDRATGASSVIGRAPQPFLRQTGLLPFFESQRVAGCSEDGHLRVWDADAGRLLTDVAGCHESFDVARDGSAIVMARSGSGGQPGTALLIDATGGNPRPLPALRESIFEVEFAAASDRVVVATDRSAIIYRVADGARLKQFDYATYSTLARFTNQDRQLVTGHTDGSTTIEDIMSGERRTIRHRDWSIDVAISPNGQLLAIPTRTGELHVVRSTVPGDPAALPAWLAAATDATIDPALAGLTAP